LSFLNDYNPKKRQKSSDYRWKRMAEG